MIVLAPAIRRNLVPERRTAMKWLADFSLAVRSSWSTFLEKVEQPERMLHQLILDMEEELERVRESVAEAIADEIRLGKDSEAVSGDAALWGERASESLARGDEKAARAALEQKLAAEARAKGLEASHARQKAQTAKLERSLKDLEEKLGEARQRKALLAARLATAESGRRLERAFHRTGSRSAFRQFRRLEERVEREEALAEAHARLAGRDPDAEELRREMEAAARREQVEREMEELRRRKEGADAE